MQKVLILITKSNWGGAQRHVFDLATRLPHDKYDVHVMAGGEGTLISKLRAAQIKADGNLPIGRDIKISGDFSAFIKLWKILRREKPAILHLHSSKIGGLGALAGKLAGVKRIIFTVHGWAFNEDRSFIQKMIIRFSYWIILLLSDRIIVVSDSARKQAEYWPFVQDKMTVIRHGIEQFPVFSQANARHEIMIRYPKIKKVVEMAGGEKNTFWIGTVAELHRIKGYDHAIRAVYECQNHINNTNNKHLIYLVAGEGDERQNIENQIKELGMENHIFLLGHVDRGYELMRAFDVFLLASLSEGLGYVLLESGVSQTAVIATTVGGIPEVVEDMDSGVLVQPGSVRELAHAIHFMIENPKERKKCAENLKKRVLENFSIEKMIRETEGVYDTL